MDIKRRDSLKRIPATADKKRQTASRCGLSLFMHRPVQQKFAAKAAHGPRVEQGTDLPIFSASGRTGLGEPMAPGKRLQPHQSGPQHLHIFRIVSGQE